MTQMKSKPATASTNTVRLHRVLAAPVEKIYRAFLDPDALAKWLPPNGFTAKVHHLEAKIGGTFKMSFTNFTSEPVGWHPSRQSIRIKERPVNFFRLGSDDTVQPNCV